MTSTMVTDSNNSFFSVFIAKIKYYHLMSEPKNAYSLNKKLINY